jgi:hypothetical protein
MEWKTIPFENNYEVSDSGLVRRIADKKLISTFDNGGYDRVKLGKKKYLVHRLIAMCYIDNPYNLETVNHKDFDKRNNSVDNLEWLSVKDNIRHAVNNMEGRKEYLSTTMSIIGKKYGVENAKRTRKPVTQLSLSGEIIGTYPSAREAEKHTGVGYKLISAVCRGDKKTAHGYKWEFTKSQSTIESTSEDGSE